VTDRPEAHVGLSRPHGRAMSFPSGIARGDVTWM
jgi:hypothetical protein